MSFLKDSKYVQHLANQCGYKDLTQDACRFILSQTELTLRQIVGQSIKYSQLLNKDKLSETQINLSLKDLNLEFITNYSSKTLSNKYQYDPLKNQYFMKSENVEIQNYMKQIIKKVDQKNRKKEFQIEFDWITKSQQQNQKTKDKMQETNPKIQLQKENFEQYLKNFCDPLVNNQFIVKKQSPNFLTQVLQKGRVIIYEQLFQYCGKQTARN